MVAVPRNPAAAHRLWRARVPRGGTAVAVPGPGGFGADVPCHFTPRALHVPIICTIALFLQQNPS